MFFEIGVLKVYNIHRKTSALESQFNKVAGLEAYKFIKKRLQHRCFPVNIANLLRKLYLTLFRMGFFGAAHGWGGEGGKKVPLPKICHTYPTVIKLGTVLPYPKKIQKIYESGDTALEFC